MPTFNTSESNAPNACELDWSIDYHNDDGCKNIRITVNGLSDDCENCTFKSYTVTLEGTANVLIAKHILLPPNPNPNPNSDFQPFYSFQYETAKGEGPVQSPTISRRRGLGIGEVIEFEYFGLYIGPLCINAVLDCGNGSQMIISFCKIVELGCI